MKVYAEQQRVLLEEGKWNQLMEWAPQCDNWDVVEKMSRTVMAPIADTSVWLLARAEQGSSEEVPIEVMSALTQGFTYQAQGLEAEIAVAVQQLELIRKGNYREAGVNTDAG